MATALDYSAGKITANAIKAAGHIGVVRYVGTPGRTKNITKDEYRSLTSQGVKVALVYENRAGDANGGSSAGVIAARTARADADAIGWPRERPIHFAIDSDQVTELDFQEVDGYLDGARSVMGNGIERTGVYGEFDVIERCVGRRARFGWQTVAWSRGKRSSKATLFQELKQPIVGGIQCDINQILAQDWGQHDIGEIDMPLNDADKAVIAKLLNDLVPGLVVDAVRHHVIGTDHDPENPNQDNWKVWTFGGRNFGDIFLEILNQAFAANAKIDGLSKIVAELANDQDITPDVMQEMLNVAVSKSIRVSGQLQIDPAFTTPASK